MDPISFVYPVVGGVLFGLATAGLMWLHGRVAGFSGILGGLLEREPGEIAWRVWFLAGAAAAGTLGVLVWPEAFLFDVDRPMWMLVPAGLLVGFGTRYGCGCTSGHGVAGNARLSPRSMLATVLFSGSAMAVVYVIGGAS